MELQKYPVGDGSEFRVADLEKSSPRHLLFAEWV
jgi:hypothetical protein